MKKQTATEYFYDQILKIFMEYHENDEANLDFGKAITKAFKKAKAMEQAQITEAFNEGALDGLQLGKQYYAFTYDTRTIY